MKSDHFRENWRMALDVAAKSPTLHKSSWFNFRWFIHNDDNYQKCLDGWMDWKDKELEKNGKAKKNYMEDEFAEFVED